LDNTCLLSPYISATMLNHRKISMTGLALLISLCLSQSGCKTADSTQHAISSPLEKPKEVARQHETQGASVFAPILPSLQVKTRVPLKLPHYLATENESNELYAIIDSASPTSYEIQLAFTPDCSGGNVCHYGVVSARAIKAGEVSPKGTRVSLANGLTGYFFDSTCDAVCSDSTLTWDQGGYRYTVGLKAEKLETMKRVAESAISK
jgi:hypothetical protein